MRRALFLAPLLPFALLAVPACGGSDDDASTAGSAGQAGSGGGSAGSGGGAGSGAGQAGAAGGAVDPTAVCKELGLPSRPFASGPYGTHRGDLSDDFSLDLVDGTAFQFKAGFSGCESYVFIPDTLAVSEIDKTPIWNADKDLSTLVTAPNPDNVHYFFVSRQGSDAAAKTNLDAMQARIDALLGTLDEKGAAHWKARLHVVAKRAASLDGAIGTILSTHGKIGFAIDRLQRIRGVGSLADVKRQDAQLSAMMKWPFKSNLAYAAYEAVYFNGQAKVQERLDADGATVVDLWKGETLMEFADTKVTLPSAAEMAAFDTLEIEVTQQCPNPDTVELGNCGAWDYLANFYLTDDAAKPKELARFITSYHRETHWVEDISGVLPLLASGGEHAFRWSFAPSWNTQPTATKLALRFSNKKKAARPSEATFLYAGGKFDAKYNDDKKPIDVTIPADAKKVELFVLVTGHGSEAGQCSEFCNHQHELSVNGKTHLIEFPKAGSNTGCVANAANGMTPNQAGTWWYGRGGWCPGMQVDPIVIDVTSEVVPGQKATIGYQGLFKSSPPTDASGDIQLSSYLVVSK